MFVIVFLEMLCLFLVVLSVLVFGRIIEYVIFLYGGCLEKLVIGIIWFCWFYFNFWFLLLFLFLFIIDGML